MQTFATREEFIGYLPTNAVIAEIGVERGIFAETLLLTNPVELSLIDYWPEKDGYYNLVVNKFASHENVRIMRDYSVNAVKTFPDRYFDWIYLDADHYYAGVITDLDAWHSKVKVGGVFAGHDYSKGIHCWVQVVEALEKWMPEHGYTELDYLTLEDPIGITPSWGFIVKDK